METEIHVAKQEDADCHNGGAVCGQNEHCEQNAIGKWYCMCNSGFERSRASGKCEYPGKDLLFSLKIHFILKKCWSFMKDKTLFTHFVISFWHAIVAKDHHHQFVKLTKHFSLFSTLLLQSMVNLLISRWFSVSFIGSYTYSFFKC